MQKESKLHKICKRHGEMGKAGQTVSTFLRAVCAAQESTMKQPEELRTMKVGRRQLYRIPRKEMGRLKAVAAFIEVGTDVFPFQRTDVVHEER